MTNCTWKVEENEDKIYLSMIALYGLSTLIFFYQLWRPKLSCSNGRCGCALPSSIEFGLYSFLVLSNLARLYYYCLIYFIIHEILDRRYVIFTLYLNAEFIFLHLCSFFVVLFNWSLLLRNYKRETFTKALCFGFCGVIILVANILEVLGFNQRTLQNYENNEDGSCFSTLNGYENLLYLLGHSIEAFAAVIIIIVAIFSIRTIRRKRIAGTKHVSKKITIQAILTVICGITFGARAIISIIFYYIFSKGDTIIIETWQEIIMDVCLGLIPQVLMGVIFPPTKKPLTVSDIIAPTITQPSDFSSSMYDFNESTSSGMYHSGRYAHPPSFVDIYNNVVDDSDDE